MIQIGQEFYFSEDLRNLLSAKRIKNKLYLTFSLSFCDMLAVLTCFMTKFSLKSPDSTRSTLPKAPLPICLITLYSSSIAMQSVNKRWAS